MALRSYPRLERPVLLAVLVLGAIGIVAPLVGLSPILSPLLIGVFVAAFVVVPRFTRVVVSGLLGGALCGIVVLGVSLRLAMRVVALTDGTDPVLTAATLGILAVGGIFGIGLGVAIGVAQRLWNPGAWLVGVVTGGVGIALFLAGEELRSELLHLGAGGWVNIPMFTACFFGFGWSATIVIRWLQQRLPVTRGRALPELRTARPAVVG